MITKEISVKQGFTSKKCPKCGGNTFIDKDINGWHEQCLQCGKSFDLPNVIAFKKQEGKGETELTKVSRS
jgi:hypothetical protein